MAPPKPAPIAAAPRRGKFLSDPSTSPSSPIPAAPAAASGSNAVDAEQNSLENLRAHVRNSKIAAVSRRKAIASQRQSVLDDLDEAENIVLSLLECASHVAGALSEMTTAKSKKRHGEKRVNEEENVADSFEDLTANVRANGVGYLAGVKKLHKLLSPHAPLVKSYKNYDGKASPDNENEADRGVAAVLPSPAGATNSTSRKIVEEATSNMYAVRVKKRLAMERSDILKEMIRLEESEGCSNDEAKAGEGIESTDTAGSKRKHESTEQQ